MPATLERFAALTLLFALYPAPAAAQAPDDNAVHWAYSTYFGTGWYRIGDGRDAFAIRLAPSKTVSEAAFDEDGKRTIGVEWRFPVTVGLDRFPLEDLAGTADLGNFASVSFTPGVHAEIPVDGRFSLRPFAAAGWGTVLDGDESAWTYWAGVRSRFILREGALETALVNSLGLVGYAPNNGPSAKFWPVLAALELGHPLATLEHERELRLEWHLAYTTFGDDLDVLERDAASGPISDQWELGVAVRLRDRPLTFWKLEFDRLGLAYRRSSDGELRSVGLIVKSLFDQ